MKKGLLLIAVLFNALSTVAQNMDLSNVFTKAFEVVNEKNGKEKFKGQILKGKRNGMGFVSFKNGSIYAGDFYRGSITGLGLLVASTNVENCENCIVYVGNWKDGKKSGYGTCYAGDGSILYQGAFIDDKPTVTYPSDAPNRQRYFSLVNIGNSDFFVGEMENGNANGFGVIVFNNGDLWQSSFKDSQKKGIGLYITYDGEWETLNFKGENCDVVSSSENYRAMDATRKANFRNSLAGAMEAFADAAQIAVAAVRVANVEVSNSDLGYGNLDDYTAINGSSNTSSTTRKAPTSTGNKSGSSSQTAAEGQAWRTESRAYSNYESMLIKMNTYWETQYNDSDRRNHQKKMKDIRTKWEKRGYHITRSEWEDWNGKKR